MILHILLTILKIILFILLFLLVVLLYLIIAPWKIRVQGQGDTVEKEFSGSLKVLGFLRFWRISVDTASEDLVSVKAFWGLLTVYPFRKKEKKEKRVRESTSDESTASIEKEDIEKSAESKVIEEKPEVPETETKESESDSEEKTSEEPVSEESTSEENTSDESTAEKNKSEEDKSEEDIPEKNTAKEDTSEDHTSEESGAEEKGVAKILRSISEIPGKISGVLDRIREIDIPGKISKVMDMITDPQNQAAVAVVIGQLKWFLKKLHIRLKDTKVTFGMDDPQNTGQICAVLSILPIVYQKDSEIVPDFTTDEMYVQGGAKIEARFALRYIFHMVLKILIDKNTRQLIRKIIKR